MIGTRHSLKFNLAKEAYSVPCIQFIMHEHVEFNTGHLDKEYRIFKSYR